MRLRGARSSSGARTLRILLAGMLACSWLQVAVAAQGPPPETLTLWNRRIVTFRATVGDSGPLQRLENTRERIAGLSDYERLKPVAVYEAHIADLDGVIVSVGSNAVFGLVPADVDPE